MRATRAGVLENKDLYIRSARLLVCGILARGRVCAWALSLIANVAAAYNPENGSRLGPTVPLALLDGLHHLLQQPAGPLVAVRSHDPVEPAPARNIRALHSRADDVRLELRLFLVVSGEVGHKGRNRVV